MLELSEMDDVTVVRMEHGKANALDREFLQAFAAAFLDLAADGGGPVVLTGTAGAFSAGVDLFRMLDGGPAYVDAFLTELVTAFAAVYDFPRPVVAAVNGHAIAGGCIFACACDHRIMASGPGRIGVTELRVGVPFPLLALEIMRAAVGERQVRELVTSGMIMPAEEALSRGLVDEVTDAGVLLERAVAVASRLATIPEDTFALTKRSCILRPRIGCRRTVQRSTPRSYGSGRARW